MTDIETALIVTLKLKPPDFETAHYRAWFIREVDNSPLPPFRQVRNHTKCKFRTLSGNLYEGYVERKDRSS